MGCMVAVMNSSLISTTPQIHSRKQAWSKPCALPQLNHWSSFFLLKKWITALYTSPFKRQPRHGLLCLACPPFHVYFPMTLIPIPLHLCSDCEFKELATGLSTWPRWTDAGLSSSWQVPHLPSVLLLILWLPIGASAPQGPGLPSLMWWHPLAILKSPLSGWG